MKISYVGLKGLEKSEVAKIKSLSVEYCEKFERSIGKDAVLILHLQKHKQKGKRVKYSLHARINSPYKILNANVSSWDLNVALHKLFKRLGREIGHKFKIKQKPYGFRKKLIEMFLKENKNERI